MKDYNFFEIYERKRGIDFRGAAPVLAGMGIVVLLAVASLGLIIHNIYMTKNIESLDAKITQLRGSDDYLEAEMLQSSISAMDKYDENAEIALEKLENAQVIDTDLMSVISSSIPVNTIITHLAVNSVTVQGDFSIPNRKEGAELILALKDSGLFSNVHANSIYLDQEGGRYIISIICDLKAGEMINEN